MDTPYEKLLEDLARAEIDFIIVGGIAVALNGFVRTTEDVDILVDAAAPNIRKLLQTLTKFGEGNARELSEADFDEAEGAIRIIEDFPLDVFTIMQGKRFADLAPAAPQTDINGVAVRYLDAETLIAIKSKSARPKDQIDVSALRSLPKPQKHTQ